MEEEDQAQAAETAANEAVKALDRELKITTKSTGSNKVQMFFRDSQAGMKLLQKIDQHQGQFHIKPVGPIGRYLSIRDEKCAPCFDFPRCPSSRVR